MARGGEREVKDEVRPSPLSPTMSMELEVAPELAASSEWDGRLRGALLVVVDDAGCGGEALAERIREAAGCATSLRRVEGPAPDAAVRGLAAVIPIAGGARGALSVAGPLGAHELEAATETEGAVAAGPDPAYAIVAGGGPGRPFPPRARCAGGCPGWWLVRDRGAASDAGDPGAFAWGPPPPRSIKAPPIERRRT